MNIKNKNFSITTPKLNKIFGVLSLPEILEKLTENISSKTANYLNSVKINNFNIFYKLEKKGLENNLVIEEIENIENMGADEMEDIILDTIIFYEKKGIKIVNIDISKILKKEKKLDEKNKKEKEKNTHKNLQEIIVNNFPINGIERIGVKENVFNFRYLKIKKINDDISKKFTDFLIEAIVKKIQENFKTNIIEKKIRGSKVNNDYKNICFSLDENIINIGEKLFGTENIEDFINNILNDLEKNKSEEFNSLIESSKLKINSGENKIEVAKKFVIKHFGIGGGFALNNSKNIEEKNLSHYKASMASKNKITGNIDDGIKKYSFKDTKNSAKALIENENKFIKKYKNSTFTYDNGKIHNVIVKIKGDTEGEIIEEINEILVQRVKKDKEFDLEINSEKELLKLELKEINSLGQDFSYFMPILEEDNPEKIITEHKKSMEKGIFKAENFTKNYKGFYNKKYLEKISKNERGLKIFVDVIGNSALNAKAFREIAKKINNGEEDISKIMKNLDETTTQILKPFVNFLIEYPKAIISVAGDEFFIFIPGVEEYKNGWNKTETNKILENLSKKISDSNLKSRIIHSYDNDISFDNLDFLTAINKLFEGKLENRKIGLKQNILFNISDDLKKKILLTEQFNQGNKENTDRKNVYNTLSLVNLTNLINELKNDNIFLDMIKNIDNINGSFINIGNIKINFFKTENNFKIELSLIKSEK